MINVENLAVYSGKKNERGFKNVVINNVSFSVDNGKAFALTGKDNNAKKLLLRLVQKKNPEDSVFVEDYLTLVRNAPISNARPFGDWTVLEYFLYTASTLRCGKTALLKRSAECLAMVGLSKCAKKKIKRLSAAEYVLMHTAINMWGEPQDVIIDAGGVKPSKKAKKILARGIATLKKRGAAVLVGLDERLVSNEFNFKGAFAN